ncbi:MATH and LRR domain-containing protein PFE0570w-like [Cherax quadricarinatus]|uniref:MATH and LRR domain-containing protein PFE0570w-like n=1 Tax=Cherax quadricarinatus TaxID=27406 RepID=UPI00387E3E3A
MKKTMEAHHKKVKNTRNKVDDNEKKTGINTLNKSIDTIHNQTKTELSKGRQSTIDDWLLKSRPGCVRRVMVSNNEEALPRNNSEAVSECSDSKKFSNSHADQKKSLNKMRRVSFSLSACNISEQKVYHKITPRNKNDEVYEKDGDIQTPSNISNIISITYKKSRTANDNISTHKTSLQGFHRTKINKTLQNEHQQIHSLGNLAMNPLPLSSANHEQIKLVGGNSYSSSDNDDFVTSPQGHNSFSDSDEMTVTSNNMAIENTNIKLKRKTKTKISSSPDSVSKSVSGERESKVKKKTDVQITHGDEINVEEVSNCGNRDISLSHSLKTPLDDNTSQVTDSFINTKYTFKSMNCEASKLKLHNPAVSPRNKILKLCESEDDFEEEPHNITNRKLTKKIRTKILKCHNRENKSKNIVPQATGCQHIQKGFPNRSEEKLTNCSLQDLQYLSTGFQSSSHKGKWLTYNKESTNTNSYNHNLGKRSLLSTDLNDSKIIIAGNNKKRKYSERSSKNTSKRAFHIREDEKRMPIIEKPADICMETYVEKAPSPISYVSDIDIPQNLSSENHLLPLTKGTSGFIDKNKSDSKKSEASGITSSGKVRKKSRLQLYCEVESEEPKVTVSQTSASHLCNTSDNLPNKNIVLPSLKHKQQKHVEGLHHSSNKYDVLTHPGENTCCIKNNKLTLSSSDSNIFKNKKKKKRGNEINNTSTRITKTKDNMNKIVNGDGASKTVKNVEVHGKTCVVKPYAKEAHTFTSSVPDTEVLSNQNVTRNKAGEAHKANINEFAEEPHTSSNTRKIIKKKKDILKESHQIESKECEDIVFPQSLISTHDKVMMESDGELTNMSSQCLGFTPSNKVQHCHTNSYLLKEAPLLLTPGDKPKTDEGNGLSSLDKEFVRYPVGTLDLTENDELAKMVNDGLKQTREICDEISNVKKSVGDSFVASVLKNDYLIPDSNVKGNAEASMERSDDEVVIENVPSPISSCPNIEIPLSWGTINSFFSVDMNSNEDDVNIENNVNMNKRSDILASQSGRQTEGFIDKDKGGCCEVYRKSSQEQSSQDRHTNNKTLTLASSDSNIFKNNKEKRGNQINNTSTRIAKTKDNMNKTVNENGTSKTVKNVEVHGKTCVVKPYAKEAHTFTSSVPDIEVFSNQNVTRNKAGEVHKANINEFAEEPHTSSNTRKIIKKKKDILKESHQIESKECEDIVFPQSLISTHDKVMMKSDGELTNMSSQCLGFTPSNKVQHCHTNSYLLKEAPLLLTPGDKPKRDEGNGLTSLDKEFVRYPVGTLDLTENDELAKMVNDGLKQTREICDEISNVKKSVGDSFVASVLKNDYLIPDSNVKGNAEASMERSDDEVVIENVPSPISSCPNIEIPLSWKSINSFFSVDMNSNEDDVNIENNANMNMRSDILASQSGRQTEGFIDKDEGGCCEVYRKSSQEQSFQDRHTNNKTCVSENSFETFLNKGCEDWSNISNISQCKVAAACHKQTQAHMHNVDGWVCRQFSGTTRFICLSRSADRLNVETGSLFTDIYIVIKNENGSTISEKFTLNVPFVDSDVDD